MLVLLKHNGMKMFFFSGHLFVHPVKMVNKLKVFFGQNGYLDWLLC